MTARIVLQRPTPGRLRFQPSRPAPSLPHQVPNEHAENTGTRKRRHPEEAPTLDPLENTIRPKRKLRFASDRQFSPFRGQPDTTLSLSCCESAEMFLWRL